MLVEYPGEERQPIAATYSRHLYDMGLVKAVKLLAAVAPKFNIFFSEKTPLRPLELDPRVVAATWARAGPRGWAQVLCSVFRKCGSITIQDAFV